jgi:preprotein translocase subunit SecE
VARDRKRAKQRRERARGGSAPAPTRSLARGGEEPPGPLEHASADAEEARAAVIAGAGAAALQAALEPAPATEPEPEPELGPERDGAPGGEIAGEREPEEQAQESEQAHTATAGTRERGGGAPQPAAERRRRASLASRTADFLRACWAELQRMQWPNRQQTSQATAVVLGFVIVAGIFLGIADLISQKVVNLIF